MCFVYCSDICYIKTLKCLRESKVLRLNNFGFTSKKLNREEAGSAAANASTWPGSEPETGPWLQPSGPEPGGQVESGDRGEDTNKPGCWSLKRQGEWEKGPLPVDWSQRRKVALLEMLPATDCATIQSVFTSVCGPKRTSCAQI